MQSLSNALKYLKHEQLNDSLILLIIECEIIYFKNVHTTINK